ncbi:calcium channel flower isoform X2 [Drosophila hydei]|uniref:Calcium channel flower n=1 Tax=Drosophila hydei TaxID=7224 RepID=A0A6J1LV02_DROHY|nr:calcium channel flower isoform X2 [Drosophila hydei]
MSFTGKLAELLARPNQEQVGAPEAPWYLKYGSRLLGIVSGFFAILFGLWNVLSIIGLSVTCLVAGIIQILAGFVLLALEAPFCFICIEKVNDISQMMDAKPLFFRAGLYCAIAVPPIFLCFGPASVFGSGMVFATGVVYGMMALGKKASREDMAAAATSPTQMSGSQTGGQMQMGGDQHITLMEDPDVWRPT